MKPVWFTSITRFQVSYVQKEKILKKKGCFGYKLIFNSFRERDFTWVSFWLWCHWCNVLFQGYNLVNRFHCNLRRRKSLEILNFHMLGKTDLYLCCSKKIVHDPDMKKAFLWGVGRTEGPQDENVFRLHVVQRWWHSWDETGAQCA